MRKLRERHRLSLVSKRKRWRIVSNQHRRVHRTGNYCRAVPPNDARTHLHRNGLCGVPRADGLHILSQWHYRRVQCRCMSWWQHSSHRRGPMLDASASRL